MAIIKIRLKCYLSSSIAALQKFRQLFSENEYAQWLLMENTNKGENTHSQQKKSRLP